jgi:hypothetical protein
MRLERENRELSRPNEILGRGRSLGFSERPRLSASEGDLA